MRRSATVLAISLFAGSPAAVAAEGGDILWVRNTPLGWPSAGWATVAPDGTIYWDAGIVKAITPAGDVLWSEPVGGWNPVALAEDGTIYTGSYPFIYALTPGGEVIWSFGDFDQMGQGIIGGPNVGPDGNIYACADFGLGAFSLTPEGELRWNVPGFGNNTGTPPSEIVFGSGHMYKAELIIPTEHELKQGLVAIDMESGDVEWTVPISGTGRSPAVSPVTQDIHLNYILDATILTFSPDGDFVWSLNLPPSPESSDVYGPAVGPDGFMYASTEYNDLFKISPQGGIVWQAKGVIPPLWNSWPGVSPDGGVVVVGTAACFGQACPGSAVAVDTADGSVLWTIELPPVDGTAPSVYGRPRFSPDGGTVYVTAIGFTGQNAHLYAISVRGETVCEPDLDGNGILNLFDFLAFTNLFNSGDPVADFDGNGVLNLFDFLAFNNAFNGGC